MMDKITITRGSVLRSKYGGYGRIVEDGILKDARYIRKYTVFEVVSINLYTQTVIAVNKANKESFSLDYDYLLSTCELLSTPKTAVINGLSIINISEEKPVKWNIVNFILGVLIEITIISVYFLLH